MVNRYCSRLCLSCVATRLSNGDGVIPSVEKSQVGGEAPAVEAACAHETVANSKSNGGATTVTQLRCLFAFVLVTRALPACMSRLLARGQLPVRSLRHHKSLQNPASQIGARQENLMTLIPRRSRLPMMLHLAGAIASLEHDLPEQRWFRSCI